MSEPLVGEALHTCTLLEHRDGGESALYRCNGCGQHILGVNLMQMHRMWEEIKHLRAERDRLEVERDGWRSAALRRWRAIVNEEANR